MSLPDNKHDFGLAVQGISPEQTRAALFRGSSKQDKTMVEQSEPIPELRPDGAIADTVNMEIYNQRLHAEKLKNSVRRKYQTLTTELKTQIYMNGELVDERIDREVREINNRQQTTNTFNTQSGQALYEHQQTVRFPAYGW